MQKVPRSIKNKKKALIKRIQERSEGAWRPSPGSIYPTLQQLVDEELIASTGGGGRASEFALTDEGRAYVDEHADEIAAAWNVGADRADARAELREYRDTAGRLMRALWQFPHEATAEQPSMFPARRVSFDFSFFFLA